MSSVGVLFGQVGLISRLIVNPRNSNKKREILQSQITEWTILKLLCGGILVQSFVVLLETQSDAQ